MRGKTGTEREHKGNKLPWRVLGDDVPGKG